MSFISVKTKPPDSQKKRLIISIGTKVSKKAVVRNLIKRRIRAILQPFLKTSGKDFFVIVRPGAENLSFEELKKETVKNG